MPINQDIWVVVFKIKLVTMDLNIWDVNDKKAKGLIKFCLELYIIKCPWREECDRSWKKIGDVYHAKYLVNKLFLWKKIYHLKMDDPLYIIK